MLRVWCLEGGPKECFSMMEGQTHMENGFEDEGTWCPSV